MKKIILFFSVVALVSCNDRVKPSGNEISMERPVGEFSALEVHSAIRATVTTGDTPHLVVTADDNILPYIETYTRGGTLIVKIRKNTSIKGEATLKVDIQTTGLNDVAGHGASSLLFPDGLIADDLKVELHGASRWEGGITTKTLNASLSGASVITADGGASVGLVLSCAGASCFNRDGYGFSADVVNANLAGASEAKVTVGSTLNVNASGASRLSYKGDPQVTKNTSGGSVVEQVTELALKTPAIRAGVFSMRHLTGS